MNFKALLAASVAAVAIAAPAAARYNTLPTINGTCNLTFRTRTTPDSTDYKCQVTQGSDGGWNIDFGVGTAYVHSASNTFIMNGDRSCHVRPTISRPIGTGLYVTAGCGGSVSFSFPTR